MEPTKHIPSLKENFSLHYGVANQFPINSHSTHNGWRLFVIPESWIDHSWWVTEGAHLARSGCVVPGQCLVAHKVFQVVTAVERPMTLARQTPRTELCPKALEDICILKLKLQLQTFRDINTECQVKIEHLYHRSHIIITKDERQIQFKGFTMRFVTQISNKYTTEIQHFFKG